MYVPERDGTNCVVNLEIPKGLPVNSEIIHNLEDRRRISELYIMKIINDQWRKLGGANVVLVTPHLKCGGAKICFCTTTKLLKFVYL
jgi:hypothetical protein